jgi:hypothetical protein
MNENPTNPSETPASDPTDGTVSDQTQSDSGTSQDLNISSTDNTTTDEATTEPQTVTEAVSNDTTVAESPTIESAASDSQPSEAAPSESTTSVSEAPAAEVSSEEPSAGSEFAPVGDSVPASADVSQEPTLPSPVVSPKSGKMKHILKFGIAFIVLIALVGGAFYLGKSHQKVVIQAPAPKPINLPPQAVVLTACVPGRGKQYIIPSDIPNGPIYDVVNSKVIAIEYNLNVQQLFSNSDDLSRAILSVTQVYPVDHFSIVPAAPISSASLNSSSQNAISEESAATAAAVASGASGQYPSYVHMIMFMVTKNVADAITCGSTTSSTTTPSAASKTSAATTTTTSTKATTTTTTSGK